MRVRPLTGLLHTLRALEATGVQWQHTLSEEDLTLLQSEPHTFISRTHELAIYQAFIPLAQTANTGHIGVSAGRALGLNSLGPLTRLLLNSANGLAFCQNLETYQSLTHVFGQLRFEADAQQDLPYSVLSLLPHRLPQSLFRFIVDRDLVSIMTQLEDISQWLETPIRVSEVHLPYPEPKLRSPYDQRFGCPIFFERPTAALLIDGDTLTSTVQQADVLEHQKSLTQCKHLLTEQRRVQLSLVDEVRQYMALFTEQFPAIQDVSRLLGLPERTLRRYLHGEGSGFQDILDAVRFSKAQHWLRQNTLSMEAIAQRLGYAEPAAFNHAFKRWTGLSPSSYKKAWALTTTPIHHGDQACEPR